MADPASRRVKIALILSLALNLLVLGVVLGAVLGGPPHHGPRGAHGSGAPGAHLWPMQERGPHHGPGAGRRDRDGGPPPRGLAPMPYLMALEPEDRQALFEAMRRNPDGFRSRFAALKEDFDAFLAVLRAPDFSPDAARAVLDRQRDAATAQQSEGAELLIARLAELPPEARLAYADRLDRSLSRGPGRRGDDGETHVPGVARAPGRDTPTDAPADAQPGTAAD
ncbi:periplasmic heavy metal sensor [Mesobaculum littorinae]|uniref:Periplasmic heavy metal sensor n=1 Tax=Mesobaculum littorinae TaxID=2486419 RepID=A0A438AJM7_9RHOB|nr:periplasmic heavy metal sensor [Mesobaculum littorinae]RVV98805.1 periplasmic heavy metal sensor [Mesobaculum littorinae]